MGKQTSSLCRLKDKNERSSFILVVSDYTSTNVTGTLEG